MSCERPYLKFGLSLSLFDFLVPTQIVFQVFLFFTVQMLELKQESIEILDYPIPLGMLGHDSLISDAEKFKCLVLGATYAVMTLDWQENLWHANDSKQLAEFFCDYGCFMPSHRIDIHQFSQVVSHYK